MNTKKYSDEELKQRRKESRRKYLAKNKNKRNKYQQEYRKKNRLELEHKYKKYYEKNRDKIRLKQKEYRKNNKDIILNKSREYHKKNKEREKEYRKNYRKNNPEKDKKRHQDYYKNNKQKISKRINQYNKKRKKHDIGYKIKCNLVKRLCMVIKRNERKGHTVELLGCSINDFKNHIKSKFTEGMTWENYGEWHIDHIIPCAVFDFTKTEAQKFCFHYTNMKPMWGNENKSKNCKVDIEILRGLERNILNQKYIKLLDATY